MPLSSEDFRQLSQVMQELTRVVREQGSSTRQAVERQFSGGAQGAQGQPFVGAAARSQAGRAEEPSQLLGFATSAARSIAANTGPIGAGIGNLLGGFAAGGPAGAAASAFGTGLQFLTSQGAARQRGILGAPLFSGRGRENFEAEFEQQSDILTGLGLADRAFDALGVTSPSKLFFDEVRKRTGLNLGRDATDVQRRMEEAAERKRSLAGATARQLGAAFGDLEAAGISVPQDQLRQTLDYFLQQNRRRQAFEQKVLEMANSQIFPSPNAKVERGSW